MEKPELEWLAWQAEAHRAIVEIGSYMGRSTRALADNTDGIVVAIDDFHGPREIELLGRDHIFRKFTENTAGLGNLVVVKENHRTIKAKPGFIPDMVFIDGSHEYADVKADIDYWTPLVKQGGLVCGHDFNFFIGVNRAVREAFPDVQIAPNTSIWWQVIG